MKVTLGDDYGSILGPELWNILYDSPLRLEVPDESHLVGYADDVAVLVTARTVEQTQRTLEMRRGSRWMADHGFSLVPERTEDVVLTKERIPTVLPIQVGETMVLSKPAVKYLGIIMDTNMSFCEQIRNTVDKAAASVFAICLTSEVLFTAGIVALEEFLRGKRGR